MIVTKRPGHEVPDQNIDARNGFEGSEAQRLHVNLEKVLVKIFAGEKEKITHGVAINSPSCSPRF